MGRLEPLSGFIGCLILTLGLAIRLAPVGAPAKTPITFKLMAINCTVTQYKLWEDWALLALQTEGRGEIG